ncbi:MAG: sugar-binding transcriptional regulator [Spirochaetaceae bacterium]|jgi:DNA-binding transcriptional regulator LsrR (DeoR family)|nr:sugar-binding transcriptional regulator [Spirochaetaceae bacterium]
MDFEEELLTKAAWYYFMGKKTQQEISVLLGVSRIKVIRLLEKASATGLVQFKLRENSARRMNIEKRLMELYGLKDAFVIPTSPDAGISGVNDAIAEAAAMYIANRMPPGAFINIGYGDTTGKTLNNLAKMAEKPVSCISLTGGVSIYLPNARSNVFNARLFLIPAPLIVSSKEMADAVMGEPQVKNIFQMISLASFTILGIGGMNDEATILKTGVLSKDDFLRLKMQGAVGDILCHYFDKDGSTLATPFEDRLISTPLSVIRNLPDVIGVAAGIEKLAAIKGALSYRYINTLITNEDTGKRLTETERD